MRRSGGELGDRRGGGADGSLSTAAHSLSVALLPAEPAGTIATRTAGAARLDATLTWEDGEPPPAPLSGEPPPGTRRSVLESSDGCTREVSAEVLAFTERGIGAALEAVLREITAAAALSEAVLETRAARLSQPCITAAPALESLLRDALEAGFPVRFSPLWASAPGAEVSLGTGGEPELERFIRDHPSWEIAPAVS